VEKRIFKRVLTSNVMWHHHVRTEQHKMGALQPVDSRIKKDINRI